MKVVDEIIKKAAERAAKETENVPEELFVGEAVQWPVELKIGKGLEGAIACETKIGYVNGPKGWLIYRGYNIFDLALHSCYEETAYLLLFGELPNKQQFEEFKEKMLKYRDIPEEVIETLKKIPKTTHPMAALRTGLSVLGNFDDKADEVTLENDQEIAIKIISSLATIAGAFYRIRNGKEVVKPDKTLSHAGNFLYMMFGEKPSELAERLMDIALILHADHGMNASTFTTMVINSSLSDLYSSIVGGIGSLKGPLHGGANEQVIYMLKEIGTPDNVEQWYKKARAEKRKVMGFGHRVYKAYDPRARILGPLAELMAKDDPQLNNLYQTAIKLEKLVIEDLGKTKKVFPNVDYYSGIVYTGLGIDTTFFTPIFAVSRVAGWCARVLEYLPVNRIFRPRAVYTGPLKREYVLMENR